MLVALGKDTNLFFFGMTFVYLLCIFGRQVGRMSGWNFWGGLALAATLAEFKV